MKIVIIVKRIDKNDLQSAQRKLNIEDKKALQLISLLKDRYQASISAVCISDVKSSEVIRECFCLGADNGYLLSDTSFDELDEDGTIDILQKAVEKIGSTDLVVMASSEQDENSESLSKKLAAKLKFKYENKIEDIDIQKKKVYLKKILANEKTDIREVALGVPLVVNFFFKSTEERHSANRIMKLFRKEINIWNKEKLEQE